LLPVYIQHIINPSACHIPAFLLLRKVAVQPKHTFFLVLRAIIMNVILAPCTTSIHHGAMLPRAEIGVQAAAALFPIHVTTAGKHFAANLNDAEKGAFRISESELKDMKRAVTSGRKEQKSEVDVASSIGVEKGGGVEVDVVEKESIVSKGLKLRFHSYIVWLKH